MLTPSSKVWQHPFVDVFRNCGLKQWPQGNFAKEGNAKLAMNLPKDMVLSHALAPADLNWVWMPQEPVVQLAPLSKKALEDAAEQVSAQHEQSEPWLQLQHINGYTGVDGNLCVYEVAHTYLPIKYLSTAIHHHPGCIAAAPNSSLLATVSRSDASPMIALNSSLVTCFKCCGLGSDGPVTCLQAHQGCLLASSAEGQLVRFAQQPNSSIWVEDKRVCVTGRVNSLDAAEDASQAVVGSSMGTIWSSHRVPGG
ncbi:hypothetical protein WJX79_008645 [Trebouxia sp. C0005]